MWERILDGVAQDFSDLPDAGHAAQLVLRLLMAALVGGVIGYEREVRGKAAGLRTHMLVALGSACFIAAVQLGGGGSDSVSRAVQGVAAGIGFLGAGSILKHEPADRITGLTTAASIWLTAALGTAAGMGRLMTVLIGATLALVVLELVFRLERRPPERP